MKVIIAGPRTLEEYELIEQAVVESGFEVTEEVSGTAKGADRLGELWAATHDVPVKQFPADWNNHGKAAGPIRNKQMGVYADALIAVWDGKSKGTKNMIDTMRKLKKPVYVKRF